ncbi:MAG: DUF3078 domain-containing protein [Chitinophagales bacterium]|nr:DUF3078 domain-containing protein [Chitinophagales bacterium]
MTKHILFLSTLFLIFTYCEVKAQNDPTDVKAKITALKAKKAEIESELNAMEASIKPPQPNWTFKGHISGNILQTTLTNWAAGGFDNFSFGALGFFKAIYNKDKHTWDNTFDGAVSFVKNYDAVKDIEYPLTKNKDLWQLSSNYSYKWKKHWFLSFNFMLRSQFFVTANPANTNLIISDFFSPGFLELAPGLTYQPVSYFRVLFSPLAAKYTFVLHDSLVNIEGGSFGNAKGEKVRGEYGTRIDAEFDKEIIPNLFFKSRLVLFNNFFRSDRDPLGNTRRFNVDVNWQNNLIYKVNKHLSLNAGLWIIYDDDIRTLDRTTGRNRPALQVNQTIGAGLVYGF